MKNATRFLPIFLLLNVLNTANAAVINYNTSGIIDYVYRSATATDTYGMGINSIVTGDGFSASFTYDDNSSLVSYINIGPTESDYEFSGSPYGSSLTVNSSTTSVTSTLDTGVTVGNNVTAPPASGIPTYWTDQGFPSTIPNPVDVTWVGGMSSDRTYDANGFYHGLIFSVDLVDLSGNLLNSTNLPTSIFGDSSWSLAIFHIEQRNQGVLEFEAYSTIANNLTVPLPPAIGLMGLGLFGLGFTRKKKNV